MSEDLLSQKLTDTVVARVKKALVEYSQLSLNGHLDETNTSFYKNGHISKMDNEHFWNHQRTLESAFLVKILQNGNVGAEYDSKLWFGEGKFVLHNQIHDSKD